MRRRSGRGCPPQRYPARLARRPAGDWAARAAPGELGCRAGLALVAAVATICRPVPGFWYPPAVPV